MGIIEKIVEANVGAVAAYANAGSERRPQRVIMNKADLYALLAERPEVEEDGHIYGLRIELGHKGHPILCIDWPERASEKNRGDRYAVVYTSYMKYEKFYDPDTFQSGLRPCLEILSWTYTLSKPRFIGRFPERVDVECGPRPWVSMSNALWDLQGTIHKDCGGTICVGFGSAWGIGVPTYRNEHATCLECGEKLFNREWHEWAIEESKEVGTSRLPAWMELTLRFKVVT